MAVGLVSRGMGISTGGRHDSDGASGVVRVCACMGTILGCICAWHMSVGTASSMVGSIAAWGGNTSLAVATIAVAHGSGRRGCAGDLSGRFGRCWSMNTVRGINWVRVGYVSDGRIVVGILMVEWCHGAGATRVCGVLMPTLADTTCMVHTTAWGHQPWPL